MTRLTSRKQSVAVTIGAAVGLLLARSAFAQGDYVAPADSLVAEGIPKIPAALAGDVGRYAKGRDANFLSWHPTKRQMLVATYFGNTPQIHHVKSPGAARTQLTFFDDRPTRGVSYPPTGGDFFIFNKDVGGDQNYQMYRYDDATSAITLLTDGKSKNSPGVWSKAGHRIAYMSTRRNGKDTDLYVVDAVKPESTRMVAQLEGGGWSALDWSPDDRRILVREMISENESYLWLFDVAGGQRTLLTPKGKAEKTAHADARFRRDGTGVYVVTDRESEFRRLAFLEFASGKYTFLSGHINWDVFEFEPSPDGTMVAYVTNENGWLVLHLLDARTGQEKPLTNVPQGVFSLRWHPNSKELGFNLDSARTPSDAHSLDVATGRLERWTFSETGGLDTREFMEPELVRWKSFDDRTLSGFLYRPPARFTGRRPVIVDIHGGPEDQFQPYFLGPQNYYLNELGVALLFPNIRGSSGYGKTFLTLDDGARREDAYRDIGALLDWIRTQPTLDADRVMVTGVSYGGHMALVTAARYPDRIRCAVDVVGPSNLVTFLEHTAAYRRDLRRVEYGDERNAATRSFLERIAPLNNASKITRPLFIVQGKNDPVVPPSESEQMVRVLRKNEVPVWYLLAKDEGHGFFKKPNREYQSYATALFVKKYLLN
jgi:dipeptidyl aminopeptidase/acylaminoacyl peptidase